MVRLRTRFLKQPVHGSVVVTPPQEQPLVEQKIEEAVKQPPPTKEELSAEVYFSRAYEKYKAGDLDGAIEDYTQILRLHPKNAQMYIYRGMMHHQKGDFERAIADNSEAIRIDPQSAYAYNNRAEAYFALQRYDEAFDDFRRAYALGNDRMMMAGLAITNHALGRTDEARDLWQRLLEKNANFKDADWVGKELNWAQPLIEEARKLIAKL